MKMKFLLASLAVCAVGTTLFLNSAEKGSDFVPREEMVAQDAQGAVEAMRMLKQNLETGEIEPSDYIKMLNSYKKVARHAEKNLEMSWEEMGPNNIGGRTRAILAVDNNTIYTGAVSGGLWKSTNAGNDWEMVESFPIMPISGITQTGDGKIYISTGSSHDNGAGAGVGSSAFIGYGLYSSDDGENWELVPGTRPNFLVNGADWCYIDEIAADPVNPSKVWIAFNDGLAYYDAAEDFLYDPGEEGALNGLPSSGCDDVQVSSDGSLIVAAFGGRAYRSLDGGENWSGMFGSNDPTLLPQSNVRRIELAISPTDANYVYALYASTSGAMRGGFYSTDKGATWTQGWPDGVPSIDPFGSNGQGWYDNVVSVDPTDPTRCIAGGVTLWEFGSETQPVQIAFNFTFPGSNLYVHSDIHEFHWAPNGDLYIGTDGGIHKSIDGGETFFTANRNLITTQFYGIAYTPDGGVIGGTQDNGTQYIPNNGTLSDDMNGSQIMGGDGIDCEVSQVTAAAFGVAFTTSQNGALIRQNDQGGGGEFYDDDLLDLIAANGGDIGPFLTRIKLYENTDDPNSQQFIEFVNPFGETVTSTEEEPIVLNLNSENLDIPFEYELPAGTTLNFYEQIVRPSFIGEDLMTEDPNYFWIGPQPLDSLVQECLIDSIPLDTTEVFVGYEYIDTTIYFIDTVFVNGVQIINIDSLVLPIDSTAIFINEINYDITETCDTLYYYGADTILNSPEHILIQDRFTSMFAIGLSGSQGVWLTREALDFNTTPDWWKVVNSVNGSVMCMEFTPDGEHLFIGTNTGRLYRVDGLEDLWAYSEEEDDLVDLDVLSVSEVFSLNNSIISGIAMDPNDKNHIVITFAGYGGTAKVRESVNACEESVTFSNIWNPPAWNGESLNAMPVYDAVIDMTDSDIVIVGTEFGMFGTDDGGDSWSILNNGDMSPGPVYDVRQQWNEAKRFQNPTNTGIVYAGSHGRGIFQSSDIVSVQEPGTEEFGLQQQLLVYPNPANAIVQADLNLKNASDVRVEIYSITGKLVYSNVETNLSSGTHTLRVPVSALSIGNYIMHVEAAGINETAKFVISR